MNQPELMTSREWLRDFFSGVRELTAEEKAERVQLLRKIAERARTDSAARLDVENWLQQASLDLPEEAAAFRAHYLEGLTARQISRALCMDKRTVHRHARRVLEAMLPVAFGLDGLFSEARRE